MHEIVNARRPVVGDKVERDAATCNQGKVRLGDAAPVFAPLTPRIKLAVCRGNAMRSPQAIIVI
jgi:hypothetical protein